MRLGVALAEGTTLPGYPHDDAAILAALDAWAVRVGRSIGGPPLYPRLFPIWCDLSRADNRFAPTGPHPPSAGLLGGLLVRGVQPAVYLLTSGWAALGLPTRPNAAYLRGDYDAELRRWAAVADRRLTEPLLVRLDWEMNGSWAPWSRDTSPGEFTAMWQHIVTVMRGETDKLRFWWCPTARGHKRLWELDQWWPGPRYVDVVGFDSYDWGVGHPPIGERWGPTFAYLDSIRSGLPVMVGETGIARVRGNAKVRADWWRGLRDIAQGPAWGALAGVVAFDLDMRPHEPSDWRLSAGMDRVTARMLRRGT